MCVCVRACARSHECLGSAFISLVLDIDDYFILCNCFVVLPLFTSACVRACVRVCACMRVCVRACVCVCVCVCVVAEGCNVMLADSRQCCCLVMFCMFTPLEDTFLAVKPGE